MSYNKHQQGNLQRLTVAVVVDDKIIQAEDGTETRQAWSANDLERLSILVRDAVGFSAVRGDSVNVLNAPFTAGVELPETEIVPVPWWEQWLMPHIKSIASVIIILALIFGLLRPVFKSLARNGGSIAEQEEARQLAALEAAGLGGMEGVSDETVTLSGGSALLLGGPEQGYEQQLNAIKGLIADDQAAWRKWLKNGLIRANKSSANT